MQTAPVHSTPPTIPLTIPRAPAAHTGAHTMSPASTTSPAAPASTMEPLSARIPGELYLWLAQLQIEGCTTNSDKLRVLLGQLKRLHDGALDYVAAHAWARDITGRLRDALVRTEGRSGRHSELLNALLDHVTTCLAIVVSNAPASEQEAARLEDLLVRRGFALSDTLLRQASTARASAYDPAVVQRHAAATLELARSIRTVAAAPARSEKGA